MRGCLAADLDVAAVVWWKLFVVGKEEGGVGVEVDALPDAILDKAPMTD